MIVCPQIISPSSGSSSPSIIWNNTVFANSLSAKNAILSFDFTVNDTLFNIFSPFIVLEIFFTCNISFPGSLSGLKSTYGYFLLDGLISSNFIFSSVFFLEVACLDFDAFALNLAINSCNSFIFSSFLWKRTVQSYRLPPAPESSATPESDFRPAAATFPGGILSPGPRRWPR